MTGLVKGVRDKLCSSCLMAGRLTKEGCRVLMAGVADSRLVVDLDKPGSPAHSGAPHCDYLFIADEENGVGWVAPLELKRGRLHADEVVRQLRGGATIAESLVPEAAPFTFRPVAACGSAPKAERNRLRNRSNRIRLHGRTEAVRLLSCGEQLVKALHS